jgi:hypothetical protein
MSDEPKTPPPSNVVELAPRVVRPTGEVRIVDRPRHYDAAVQQEKRLHRSMGREARQRDRLAAVLRKSIDTVKLRAYVFMTDEELTALKLTAAQKAIVRSYEMAKRNVPFAIESADGHVKAALKGQQEKTGITLNVENMTLNLPEKKEPEREAVVIDVDTTKE